MSPSKYSTIAGNEGPQTPRSAPTQSPERQGPSENIRKPTKAPKLLASGHVREKLSQCVPSREEVLKGTGAQFFQHERSQRTVRDKAPDQEKASKDAVEKARMAPFVIE